MAHMQGTRLFQYRTFNHDKPPVIELPEGTRHITPITRKDGSRVTISDILALKKELELVSKMVVSTGKHRSGRHSRSYEVPYVLNELIRDLSQIRDSYHGANIQKNWYVTIEQFMVLTPLCKAHFNGVSLDSMRRLLLETRRDVVLLQYKEPKRVARRRLGKRGAVAQSADCADPGRLTPKTDNFYASFFEVAATKSLGSLATFNHPAQSSTRYSRVGSLHGRLLPGKIVFVVNDEEITRENWKSKCREYRDAVILGELPDFEKKLANQNWPEGRKK